MATMPMQVDTYLKLYIRDFCPRKLFHRYIAVFCRGNLKLCMQKKKHVKSIGAHGLPKDIPKVFQLNWLNS